MSDQIRVRFAPSPTGGLHLGGVRTALFNYLFARQNNGKFILRVEDTDQTRFVEGAEKYIMDCLNWCGITPDESPQAGGEYGPYRQSERKALYRQYAEQLVAQGNAYYAFDTPEELDQKREEIPNYQYGHAHRNNLRNSIFLPVKEVQELLEKGTPHVIRIKMPVDETIGFNDLIRGRVIFETNQVDDKVLLKADGMPTYHLAVVVDDYLMKITHAFRGEEWLPSAPVHLLLWEYLGWKDAMPQWAHLPLILKPDGHGKLSKRDGDRLGFPVYAMNWTDQKSGDLTKGFRELGFLPEAFVNLLALLGWNNGTDQELFTLEELVREFSLDRINKAGAQFDFEKAKWFNHEWIKQSSAADLEPLVIPVFRDHDIFAENNPQLKKIIDLVKDRCTLVSDFYEHAAYFFQKPAENTTDWPSIQPKWNAAKTDFFQTFIQKSATINNWTAAEIEADFKALAAEKGIKIGEVMLPFRVILVGGKFGPAVFDIAEVLGIKEVSERIEVALLFLGR
ncbi:MAG: glutamate--tRNA ligase [Janthinobacterium lividum]